MLDEDLLLKNYDYKLDESLIAKYPVLPKEEARLLVYYRKTDELKHLKFKDLNQILPQCSIVFNDSKVIKARIYGHKISGAKVELFFHKALNNFEFIVQLRARVKKDDVLLFAEGLKARVIELLPDGLRKVEFFKEKKLEHKELLEFLEKNGHIPLPPYIKRADEKADEKEYQSIFAKNLGSVAAPTASLHFSKELLKELEKKHKLYYLSLHIGAGTFKNVECENINEHKMHAESFFIDENLEKSLLSEEKILAVGTTVARTVENFYRTKETTGLCSLFLHPKNPPKRVDYLLTNFHLPKSSLIMLVSAFIGRKKTLELYELAMKERYRFYSYGDAMLIL